MKIILLLIVQSLVFSQTLTNSQLDAIKASLQSGDTEVTTDNVSDAPNLSLKEISIDSNSPVDDSTSSFGYSYFLRDINFFDNIPTPENFKLGSGDEIVISMWGERNTQEAFVLNKDGSIYYNKIGFVNLSNQTLGEAENTLIEFLSKTYSTLKDKNNPTELRVTLGQLKSINVFFTGFSNRPGVHLIHPFSDIYSAITQSGGVNLNGSLRNIELIREGKTIATVDFYSFFIKGENTFSKIKLVDGDIIHIPNVKQSIEISGAVLRPGVYELNNGEDLEDLINYAGGLSSSAHSKAIIELVKSINDRSSNDALNESKFIDISKGLNIELAAVASISILSGTSSSDKVTVAGTVKTPGNYPASNLKEVLDVAGGFNDPTFIKKIRKDSITILRKDLNQIYANEFKVSYKDSENFVLEPEDVILVYGNSNYRDPLTIKIEGEIVKPGSYLFKEGMTVGDVINLAEGIGPFGNANAIELFSETGTKINNISLKSSLPLNARINIPKISNTIVISGGVYRPGAVIFNGKQRSLSSYIISAGGFTENAIKSDIQILKSNGDIVKPRHFFGKVFAKIDANDTIIIPTKEKKEFDPVTLSANIVSLFTNLATIIFIIDSQ